MFSHAALIAKLEAAPEGTRELSDEVLVALGWTTGRLQSGETWTAPDGTWECPKDRPDPSRSLDAAVDLVPGGYGVCLVIEERTGRGRAFIGAPEAFAPSQQAWAGYEVRDGKPINIATPALALCIAILKALEADDG